MNSTTSRKLWKRNKNSNMKKIGIFAGTFDPVHIGHIAFALRAIEKAQLDKVIFLPERQPRYKQHVTDFKHRLQMLKLSAKSFEFLEVLDLPEPFFTIKTTLPGLQKAFDGTQLCLMMGSDVAQKINDWSDVDELAKNVSLIVGLRKNDTEEGLVEKFLKINPALSVKFITTRYPEISATQAREDTKAKLAPAVDQYIKEHRLYI